MYALNVQPELRGQITDMEANAENEGEVAFDLGARSLTIERYITRTISNNQLKIDYYFFQRLASKLDIDLPDQPPEETAAQPKMETFLQNQTNHLVECLCKHKSQYIREMYVAGKYVEGLTVLMAESKEHANKVAAMQSCIKNLERTAKQIDIDISEELSKVRKPEAEQLEGEELTELKKQLKKKLCKAKQVEPKRSEIDPTRIITNEYWAVSLVRLPDTTYKNKEHAFLVLEGKTGNMSIIWFADFVANNPFDLLRPGIRDGKVRMDYHDDEAVASSELLFRCRRNMMEIKKADRLLYSTWSIPKPTAEKLIQNIQAQESNPPKYNVLGNSVLAACSATSSSNPTSHNCFTFARMMLHDLNDKYIEIPEDRLGRWIYSATSRFLVDRQFNNQISNYTLLFGLLTFMAGALIAYTYS